MSSKSVLSSLRSLGTVALAVGALALPPAAPPAHADGCRFVLGFATLHDLLPRVVGQCVDDEQHNPANGDGLQHTTGMVGAGGLLVWRKADNRTAFTDGYRTWVNGPTGLEYRLNTQRFAWEANPDGLPVVPDAHVGASQFVQSGPRLRLVDTTLGYVQGPLTFQLAGGGFRAGETVTLRGSYTPAYLVGGARHTCAAEALGPLQVTADSRGGFTASLQAAESFHTGGAFTISATGASSGASTSVSGGAEAVQVNALPASCGA